MVSCASSNIEGTCTFHKLRGQMPQTCPTISNQIEFARKVAGTDFCPGNFFLKCYFMVWYGWVGLGWVDSSRDETCPLACAGHYRKNEYLKKISFYS